MKDSGRSRPMARSRLVDSSAKCSAASVKKCRKNLDNTRNNSVNGNETGLRRASNLGLTSSSARMLLMLLVIVADHVAAVNGELK